MNNQIAVVKDQLQETPIGLIPYDWELSKIGSLFGIQQGKALSQKHRKGISPRPFLRTANVLWGKLDLNKLDEMDFSNQEENKFTLQRGDLLTCEGGEIGRTAIWNTELATCYYQNHIHRLRAISGNVEPLFYMYWMQNALLLTDVYMGVANQTTIANLSKSRLSSLLVPLPSLHEQKAIAKVLSTVQRAIEATEQVIQATKELKKSLMKYLFTYGAVHVDEADKVKLKETEIGMVPEEWEVTKFGEIASLHGGYSFKSTDFVEQSNTQLIRMGNLYQNTLDLNRAPIYLPDKYYEIHKKYALDDGDLIISLTGTMGKEDYGFTVKIPSTYSRNLLLNQRVAKIEVADESEIIKNFLYYFMLTRVFLDYLYKTAKGTKQANISTKSILNLLVCVPSKKDQLFISNILESVDLTIERENGRKSSLESLFNTLLNNLMTGKIRVSNFGEQENEARQ